MAPQYAPSLRSRVAPLLLLLQSGFIVLFAFFTEIDHNGKTDTAEFRNLYSVFQDVNVVLIVGFGFLGSFLVRHGFSGSGFNLLVAAITTQWAILLNGFESYCNMGKIRVSLMSLVVAEMCAASALISMGFVLGKLNPFQLVLMALLEVSGFCLNEWLLRTLLKTEPLYGIRLLHVYAAFFGLSLTWILYRKGSEERLEKEKSDQKTRLFSMLGTVFLWMFWPSFNSVQFLPRWRLDAVYSTYLAMAVSAVTAAAISVLSSPRGKFNVGHMQTCILAGGISVGVSMTAVSQPWEAMTIGFTAAVVSTLGFRYLKPHMLLVFQCHDTCAALSTHGLPGLLGWLTHLLLQFRDSDDLTLAVRFAVFHIYALLITLSLSLCTGALTGLLLKWNICRPPPDKKCFDDQAFWEFHHLAVRK
ncbi:rh blood group, D antigen [Genypterus blacodes]|uniref:rh blood group, D antigen n=1 Tax=Genypterus blacodes TaxID=154954 RepID=UPI003F759FE1